MEAATPGPGNGGTATMHERSAHIDKPAMTFGADKPAATDLQDALLGRGWYATLKPMPRTPAQPGGPVDWSVLAWAPTYGPFTKSQVKDLMGLAEEADCELQFACATEGFTGEGTIHAPIARFT